MDHLTPERQLFIASGIGDDQQVQWLLDTYPNLDVNWKDHTEDNPEEKTSLYVACQKGHHEVVKILLTHQGISLNLLSKGRATAFYVACAVKDSIDCVRLLVADPRCDVNARAPRGRTPIRQAADRGCVETIKCLILSGRILDLGPEGDKETDPIMHVQNKLEKAYDKPLNSQKPNYIEIRNLLVKFKRDPEGTRRDLRKEQPSVLFALVVFECDGLLKTRDNTPADRFSRFFRIAHELPLELQRLLCNRVFGWAAADISQVYSEVAFHRLTKREREEDKKRASS